MTAARKYPPQQGQRPSLEFRPVHELKVDDSYQRDVAKAMVERIAKGWNWTLCAPLTVARRDDGALYVIDGQHRLAAARARNDIYDLLCIISNSVGAVDEAETFQKVNTIRRPLSAFNLFKAALVAGDADARRVQGIYLAAGLSLARHTNYDCLQPSEITQPALVAKAVRYLGERKAVRVMDVIAKAYDSEALRYLGSILPGLIVFYQEVQSIDDALLIQLLRESSLADFHAQVVAGVSAGGGSKRDVAAVLLHTLWQEANEE